MSDMYVYESYIGWINTGPGLLASYIVRNNNKKYKPANKVLEGQIHL